MRLLILVALILLQWNYSYSQKPIAFPGAEGCGKYTTGGRGGKVIYVNNLNDSGEGSLRHALTKTRGKRTILFSISGTIYLKSIIEVKNGDFTLAGHSAPGDGICVAGDGIDIDGADNIIIRYMRFRPGDIAGNETDALTIKRCKNVMVDHCSMSWSTDETCSCYDNSNFTLQWCIISESLNNSNHHKGEHGYGGIWGGKSATFHHNLLAHHTSRNPRLHGSRYHKQPELEKCEIVNNVVYNWSSKCIYGGEEGVYAITENYFKPGPATGDKASESILEPYQPFSLFFFENNFIETKNELSINNHKAVTNKDNLLPEFSNEYPFQISDYNLQKARDIYQEVLQKAGASKIYDSIDIRILTEVKKGTYSYGDKGIINSQKEVGAWPVLKAGTAPVDSDKDGLPDFWEENNQLDKNDLSDGAQHADNCHYTHLEVYLNSLCNQ